MTLPSILGFRAKAILGSFALLTVTAEAITYRGTLVPEGAGGRTGSGWVEVEHDPVTHRLSIHTSFEGLSAGTTVAHIHAPTATPLTGAVGVAVTPGTLPSFPAGVQAGDYSVSLDLTALATFTGGFRNNFGGGTAAGAEAALAKALDEQRAYFNIHSTAFQGGEIRAFLTRVPDMASTGSILMIGLAGLGIASRRFRS